MEMNRLTFERAALDYFGEVAKAPQPDQLTAIRNARITVQREHARIVHMYKGEIYDWCGHDLACEIVSQKSGVHERIVRSIIAKAGTLF